jgi:DnaJ-class molecular chaperone
MGGHTYTQQNGPFTYTQTGGNSFGADFDFGGFSNPFDIFEQFFGGAAFNGGQQSRGKQLETYKISISFLEAANGVQKEVSINGRKKNIKIPAGVDDGQKIRFSDFILYIDVKPDKVFKRDGNDVYINFNISLTQAILGDTVEVPTLKDDTLKIRIKPGTQPNTLVRLRGQGIKDVNGYGQGDLYIRLFVEIPSKLSSHQKDLIKQLDL